MKLHLARIAPQREYLFAVFFLGAKCDDQAWSTGQVCRMLKSAGLSDTANRVLVLSIDNLAVFEGTELNGQVFEVKNLGTPNTRPG